jgi:beta-lactamase class A
VPLPLIGKGASRSIAPFRRHHPTQFLSTTGHNGTTRIVLMRLFPALLFAFLNLTTGLASALSLNTVCLETKLGVLVKNFQGRVGICVSDGRRGIQVHGNQRFPMYSVFKLAVAVAVLDGVDKGRLHLDDVVTLQQKDLATGVQPLAKRVGPNGFKTTIRDLLFRMIVDSDGAATNFLIGKAGGPRGVQSILGAKQLKGFKIDRDEQELDTEGFHASQRHDTATPIALANLLQWLANGQLLSQASSALLLEAMTKTRTFPDRLRAGVPNGWLVAHNTGSGDTWRGVTSATNDVGILMAPDASSFVVAVLIADSKASDHDRAGLIAKVAQAVGECSQ